MIMLILLFAPRQYKNGFYGTEKQSSLSANLTIHTAVETIDR
jgi:hypothetical protein